MTEQQEPDYVGQERRGVDKRRERPPEKVINVQVDPKGEERREGFARRKDDDGLHDWDFE